MLTQRRKETGKPGSGMLCIKLLEKNSSKHQRTPVREELLYNHAPPLSFDVQT